jgi:hypothetical protein
LKAHYTKITDDSTPKGPRVACAVQMRSLIGQQSNCPGFGGLCAAKGARSDYRRRHHGISEINRLANLWRLKKVKKSIASPWFPA